MTRIHVELLEEGVEVYRSVEATEIAASVFRIESPRTSPDEIWRFPSRAVVRCRRTRFSGGEEGLLAVERLEG